jgi:mannose-6-phosphate isomerase-like protein (cupin superfamily)
LEASTQGKELAMPKVSKETAADVREMGPVTDRRTEMDGYTVEFVSFAADADLDGPLQSLPGGSCQCPHWGYVLAGRMRFVYGDREEVYEAGDAFYTPHGHRPYVEAGTEILQFSPTEELGVLERAIADWMSAQQGANS